MTHPKTTGGGSSWGALRYPQYRWMVAAQAISYMGSWMQLAAVNWHVYELTGSATALGLVGLVRVVPIIVFSMFGGVIADAYDRRRLMILTSTLLGITAGILAIATFNGSATLGLLYLMTAIMSGLSAFDKPAWASLLPNLVPKERLGDAVRLNVVLVEITAVLGPVLAGILLAKFNTGAAYAFNALSFIPVVLVLLFVHVPPIRAEQRATFSLKSFRDGLRFVRRTPLLWSTMILDFFATFFSSAIALLPVYASDILHVGAEGYGLLYAAPAIGATAGALAMAQIGGRLKRQGQALLWAVAAYGVMTIIFGFSTTFWLSLVALAVAGLADSVSMVIRNAVRQLTTPDHLRGRMLSINMIFFMGGPQLGEFEAGVVAQAFGAPFSVISGGIGTLVVVGLMAARVPVLRRYTEGDSVTIAPLPDAVPLAPAPVTGAAAGD
jgi:MFS family permease